MSASASETLTAALRRLSDEHASGLLSVATPGRDVVLELADGVPVGIGPTHDVSGRVGREAGPSLVAAAVVDDLVDRTVAAIVGGGGDWTWDVSSDADMMPVPEGLATELSRRAVDAAQALAALDPGMVLLVGRDLETTGEVDRVRGLFDGERSIEEVAREAGITVPACATIAAALVRAGVLSTGMEDAGPPSWTATVAGVSGSEDEDEDEPELWIMDEPDELEDAVEDAVDEPEEPGQAPAAATAGAAEDPAAGDAGTEGGIAEAMEWVAGDDVAVVDETGELEASAAPAAATPSPATAASTADDDDWDDTTWLDELDGDAVRQRDDDPPVVESTGEQPDHSADARTALSSMLNDLQGSSAEVQPRQEPPPAPRAEDEPEAAEKKTTTDATRKEPRAEPGEVAEFLRELSRLALDDD